MPSEESYTYKFMNTHSAHIFGYLILIFTFSTSNVIIKMNKKIDIKLVYLNMTGPTENLK